MDETEFERRLIEDERNRDRHIVRTITGWAITAALYCVVVMLWGFGVFWPALQDVAGRVTGW